MLTVAPLVGCSQPRIGTIPVGDDARAREAVSFARDTLGVDLLGWQETLLMTACRTKEDGTWQYRTSLAITARQSGKSCVTVCRILAGLCLWGERLIISASQSRDVTLESHRICLEIAEEAGLPIKKVKRAVGSEEIIFAIDGRDARLKVVSATTGGARGLSADTVILDELREMKSFGIWSALEKTRRSRPNSQCWCISTEGTHESVVLDSLQVQGRQAIDTGAQTSLCYLEWSARPDRSPDDPAGWCESNPALGTLVTEDTIRAELATDPPETFEMEVLCRRVAVDRSWLRAGVWEATSDRQATVPDSAVGEVTFAVDAAPDLSHASIDVAWLRPDGRLHVEAVAAYQGAGASASAEQRLHELVVRWQPRSLAVHAKGAAEALAGRVAAATETALVTVSAADVDRAARSFYEATATGRLVHPPDPVLAAHLEAAQQGEPGTFVLRRRNPAAPIDAAVAAVLACWAADRTPVVTAPSWVAW